jgi:hypothetical protein
MTFGRPVMISTKWAVPLPSLIDDEYLQTQGEGVQPQDVPSRLGLLAYSSKLFLVLEDILSTFYSSHPDFNVTEVAEDEVNADKILSDVLSLNRRLDNFLAEMPLYLRYVGPPMQETSPNRSVEIQRQVLHCRHVGIHKPSLKSSNEKQVPLHQGPSPATRGPPIHEVPVSFPLTSRSSRQRHD